MYGMGLRTEILSDLMVMTRKLISISFRGTGLSYGSCVSLGLGDLCIYIYVCVRVCVFLTQLHASGIL